MMKHSLLNNKGLSYIEIVISALVFSTVFVACYVVHNSSRNMLALGHHKLVALFWAQSGIEANRAGIVPPVVANVLSTQKGGISTITSEDRGGSGIIGVEDQGWRKVAVEVSWTE